MNRRILRLNELIKQQLSQIIHDEFCEKYGFITVNFVDISKDLGQAKIGLSFLNSLNQDRILQKINDKNFDYKYILMKKLSLRMVPNLEFILDNTSFEMLKMEKLIDKINQQNE